MSKKNKKSRFTKSDVNAICMMQRKIDAYESYLFAINRMLHSSGDKILPIVLMNTDMDTIARDSYKIAKKLRSEANAGNNLLSELEKFNQELLDNGLVDDRVCELWKNRLDEYKKFLIHET